MAALGQTACACRVFKFELTQPGPRSQLVACIFGHGRLKLKIHRNLQKTANAVSVTLEQLATRARMACRSPHGSLFGAKWWSQYEIVRTLLLLFTVSLALAMIGCTNSSQRHSVTSFAAPNDAAPRPRLRRSDQALLAVQHAPDCKLEGLEPDPIKPDLWERLKVEYERNCYKQAEALVRKRLRLLQRVLKSTLQEEPDTAQVTGSVVTSAVAAGSPAPPMHAPRRGLPYRADCHSSSWPMKPD